MYFPHSKTIRFIFKVMKAAELLHLFYRKSLDSLTTQTPADVPFTVCCINAPLMSAAVKTS